MDCLELAAPTVRAEQPAMSAAVPLTVEDEPAVVEPPVSATELLGEGPEAMADVEGGAPGSSLRREYDRRKISRETRIREKHKRLGGLILALSDEPATTKAFATGALGEERLAARLEKDCSPNVLFLHNRKLGKGRRDGDIDHIAIAPSGIFIVDAKRYPNSAVRIQRTGGIFSPVVEKLMVAGRDRSKLLEGCEKQVTALKTALEGHHLADTVPVAAVLCFVEADLPLFGSMQLRGVRLIGPKATVKLLRMPGELDAEDRRNLHHHLSSALPPA